MQSNQSLRHNNNISYHRKPQTNRFRQPNGGEFLVSEFLNENSGALDDGFGPPPMFSGDSSFHEDMRQSIPISGFVSGQYSSIQPQSHPLDDPFMFRTEAKGDHMYCSSSNLDDNSPTTGTLQNNSAGMMRETKTNSSFRVENRRARPKIIKNVNNICNIFIFQNNNGNTSTGQASMTSINNNRASA